MGSVSVSGTIVPKTSFGPFSVTFSLLDWLGYSNYRPDTNQKEVVSLMKFAKRLGVFSVSALLLSGCSNDTPKQAAMPVVDQRQSLAALQEKIDVQTAKAVEAERRVAFVEDQKTKLESIIQVQQTEFTKLKTEFNDYVAKYQLELKSKLAEIDQRKSELEIERQRAASRFAQLGNIEKQIAIEGLQLLRAGKYDDVYVQQRNLVAIVGTKEANKLVADWDAYQSKQFGLEDALKGALTTKKTQSGSEVIASAANAAKLKQDSIDTLTKQLADKRKSLKDIHTKGTAIKRQMTRMEGTNSPIGQSKLKELETEFDKLQDEYRDTNSDISKIESDLKELGVDLGPHTQDKSTKKGGGI